jgi:hypothetical protein
MKHLLLASALLAFPSGAAKPAPPRKAAAPVEAKKPAERPPFTWDIPNAHEPIAVPGTLEANGVPIRLRAVKSTWKVEDLMGHVARSFAKAGLYIPPPAHQLQMVREPTLTALDPDRQISYTAFFQPNPDGTTTVIMGEGNVGKRKKSDGKYFAPLFPGAAGVVSSDVEGARTLAYSVKASGPEVQKYYADVLSKEGYQQREPGTFAKEGKEIRVIASAAKDGQTSVAVIARLASEDAAPPR